MKAGSVSKRIRPFRYQPRKPSPSPWKRTGAYVTIKAQIQFPLSSLSAHSSPDEERRALQAGAVQFLQKPVSKEVLLLAIRNAVKTPPDDER